MTCSIAVVASQELVASAYFCRSRRAKMCLVARVPAENDFGIKSEKYCHLQHPFHGKKMNKATVPVYDAFFRK